VVSSSIQFAGNFDMALGRMEGKALCKIRVYLETFVNVNARWTLGHWLHLMYQVSLNNKEERSKDRSFA
jgi:hypothetical protein